MRSSSGPLSLRRWRATSASEQRQLRSPATSAGTRVRRREQLKARREDDRPLAAHDRHVPVLQRLAQRLESRAVELRQLVEEEDAVVREARLARPRQRSSADEPGGGDRVVRRPERALPYQSVAVVAPDDAVDAGHGDRLVGCQRGEDRRHATGEHRLAGAGRSGQQDVVASGGGDRQRPTRLAVAAHVGEIRARAAGRRRVARDRRGRFGRPLAAQDRRDLAQTGDAGDREAVDERRLAGARARHDEAREARAARALRDGQHAAAVAQLAAERQLAEHRPALEVAGGQLLGGDEHAARRRQVESRPDLAQMGGREVDRDPPLGELEPRVEQGALHPLARLSHGGVAAADDRERRQAAAQVDLDGDPARGRGRRS